MMREDDMWATQSEKLILLFSNQPKIIFYELGVLLQRSTFWQRFPKNLTFYSCPRCNSMNISVIYNFMCGRA
jgi:hypothetical protein